MAESTPLSLLLGDFLPASLAEAVEKEATRVEFVPPVRRLNDLRFPEAENDPTELIAQRFLYRGAVCLVVGPTGVGKSSFLMQLGIHLAVGKALFGIEPGSHFQEGGMRVLLIQAENDEGDLAEMRNGVLAGCADLTDADKAQAQGRILVCTVNDRTGDRFILTLDALLTENGPFEVVIVDPAFAYVGGDSNAQKDVSRFMREMLNPLVQRHQVGLILAHHTNKPLRGKEKDKWEAGDYAYLGAGSAEWINPARSALAIRSLGSDTVFELRAPKRGKRLRWRDEGGQPTVVRHIAHHREAGIICWREADPAEVEEVLAGSKAGRRRKLNPIEVVHCIHTREGLNQRTYRAIIRDAVGCSESAIHDALHLAECRGWICSTARGKEKLYAVTGKGKSLVGNCPTTNNWMGHWSEIPE